MTTYIVDKIQVEPRENQYGWSVGVLSEDKFIWVNGDIAKELKEGDEIHGVLVEKPYVKDGETKVSYQLKDENSKAAKEFEIHTQVRELEKQFNELAKRVSKVEEIIWPED